ncbi:tigger transposable element-derived protein 6-like [Ruditapes philippinarum]|uniref:tigger transposable element-derived protein 6-like n=1 Tax=Ruditapes philippinarum TaxID=129788 RepID=UPI00295C34C4|nr:tigger transposable element-derived protein 6-like [Ruditapes philippinarum]
MSKERITVALCASAEGEKLKPIVIGKSENTRCFKNINKKDLLVHYYFNKKAWMTSNIYKDFLKNFNKKMKQQKRKVLLFVDNAPSHPDDNSLSNVLVKFLPPNTTSMTQPMDQGIIRAMKLKFRKRQMSHMVTNMDIFPTLSGSDLLKRTNVRDAIYWLSNSWNEVESSTIVKCFGKAGFKLHLQDKSDIEISVEKLADEPTMDDDDDIPLSVIKISYDLFGCSFSDLVKIDDNVNTCDSQNIDWDKNANDLVKDLFKNEENKTDEDDDGEEDCDKCNEEEVLTTAEAVQMISKLKAYSLKKGNPAILKLMSEAEEKLNNQICMTKKQTTMLDFFNRDGR